MNEDNNDLDSSLAMVMPLVILGLVMVAIVPIATAIVYFNQGQILFGVNRKVYGTLSKWNGGQ